MYKTWNFWAKTTYAFLFFGPTVMAQPIDSSLFEKYERPSVAFVVLNFENKPREVLLANQINRVRLSDKYNSHFITRKNILQSPYSRNYILADRYKKVNRSLDSLNVGAELVKKWFSIGDSASYNTHLLQERGFYNASQQELQTALLQKRGTSLLKDAGEYLINNTYIIVLDFFQFESWVDYYSKNANVVQYKNSGYKGAIIAYIYQLNWDESTASDFYKNAWNDTTYFNKMKFSMKYVNQVYVSGINSTDGSDEAGYAKSFFQSGINKVMKEAARNVPALRVRTPLSSTKPILAKIGTKEGVKIDQKFLVYERYFSKKGQLKFKKKGSLRATARIADNLDTLNGKRLVTKFYQDAGKKLYPGLLLEQRYEYGVSINAGWAQRLLQGPYFRLEIGLAKLFHWPMFKLYADAHLGAANLRFGNGNKDYQLNAWHLGMGLSKEFVLLKNIHLEPFVGIAGDNISFQLNKEELFFITTNEENLQPTGLNPRFNSTGAVFGLRMPINLYHNLQLIPSVCFSTVKVDESGLFGQELPQNIPTSVKRQLGVEDSAVDWYKNSNTPVNNSQIYWDIVLRLKF